MALNLDVIGKKLDPVTYDCSPDKMILYALGIGAGVEQLDFVYEKNMKVYPTFAVIPFFPAFMAFVSEARINMVKLLHGEHKIVLYKPIPIQGKLVTTGLCTSIYDKGDKGALVNVDFDTTDGNGDLIFKNQVVLMDRSAGNFGGDRGPMAEKIVPPEGKEPDFEITHKTTKDQGALYRLSGDLNPIHIEPEFARKGGFDKPILHGLCTYSIAGRAILEGACGGEPSRVKTFAVRFMNVVFPGDTLTTYGWNVGDGRYVVITANQDGKVILGNAQAEIIE